MTTQLSGHSIGQGPTIKIIFLIATIYVYTTIFCTQRKKKIYAKQNILHTPAKYTKTLFSLEHVNLSGKPWR